MKIVLSAESTIDLTKELLNEYNIHTVPFTVLLGDKMFLDGEMKNEEIFDFVSKNKVLPKTSAVNEFQYKEHFNKLLNEYDEVIHFCLSSGVSCAYNNALSATKNMPNVHIIDTKSLSSGIALLAFKASQMIDENKSAKEIVEEINILKEKLQVSLIINKLDYLKKGGRCSSLLAFGANLLQIHPQIIVKNGSLTPAKKFRGNYDHCIKMYCEDIIKQYNNIDDSLAFVAYTTASENAIKIAKDSLINAGFKKVLEATTGATISSHCGPNALGILYLTK